MDKQKVACSYNGLVNHRKNEVQLNLENVLGGRSQSEGTVCVCACMLSCFSHVQLFATLWTTAQQASLSMKFSRQEYCSRLPFPSPIITYSSVNYIYHFVRYFPSIYVSYNCKFAFFDCPHPIRTPPATASGSYKSDLFPSLFLKCN